MLDAVLAVLLVAAAAKAFAWAWLESDLFQGWRDLMAAKAARADLGKDPEAKVAWFEENPLKGLKAVADSWWPDWLSAPWAGSCIWCLSGQVSCLGSLLTAGYWICEGAWGKLFLTPLVWFAAWSLLGEKVTPAEDPGGT